MNKENSSYQYTEENGDVDVRCFEDLKDCFAETNQYGMLEEKVSVEAKVPYVFQTDNMCLIAGCTGGTEGQFLYVVRQFEEEMKMRVRPWTYGMSMFYISIC